MPKPWILILSMALCAARAVTAQSVDFVRDVEPLLSKNCHACHSADKHKAGLRLDHKPLAMKGGDSGAVIVPGKSSGSLLIQLVSGADPDRTMPPKGERLSAAQIQLLSLWIDQGAAWPDNLPEKGSTHWSLQPLRKPAAPNIDDSKWVRNDLDRFVLAELRKAGLEPNPEADRRTLIRRASFDLTGLPPSPAEVDAFVNDPDPLAYEKLIERLLASPHYGERWARHWLDIVRYSESQGFEYDKLRKNAWHYRDYVINAFNADKPYNQFMYEQIAGDVSNPTPDSIVATSMLVCGAWDEAGNAQANATQRLITREEEMEDMISVVGQSFLGLTVNCARCHTHKFDPIPHADYYRIKSVFEGVKHGERPIAGAAEIKQQAQQLSEINKEIEARNAALSAIESAGRSLALASRTPGSGGQNAPVQAGPRPIARWNFELGCRDQIGAMHGELQNGAVLDRGRLIVNGQGAFFRSQPIASDIREKTLEVWLYLPNLEQGGGGAMTLETPAGAEFDSIVFAERQKHKWMAGSNGFTRTKDLSGMEENAKPGEVIHMAMVYGADGSITAYRNGKLYAPPYVAGTAPQQFTAGKARVLIGMRHTGGGNPFLNAEIEQASLYDRALSAADVAASFESSGKFVSNEEIASELSPAQRAQREQLMRELKALRARLASARPVPVSYAGTRIQPKPTARLLRGNVTTPAETVTPGALSCIAEPSAEFGLAENAPEEQRRLKFAQWLSDPKNPLPARVMANRIWQYHFGQPLVATPSDFGVSGAKPSHPQMLDWLAATFIERGWSIKEMHRLILFSAAYRQSAGMNPRAMELDADNRLIWRFSPRRLEAEIIRDETLSVAGELNLEMGGPSFAPFVYEPFPANIYRPVDKTGPEFNRRTVYRMNVNSGKDTLLDTFDCPDPAIKTPRRGMTTTPLQALALMNNAFVLRQSKNFADRVMKESGGELEPAIALAYRYAFGRAATAPEISRAAALARVHGMPQFCWALLNASEFIYVE